jgi:REP element-mobilizing transposase RayT
LTYQRRSTRLRQFDYATPGAYFLTICARNRESLFGEVVDDGVRTSEAGRIVEAAWAGLPEHYPHVALDAFIVMPNHVHGILILEEVGAGFKPAPTNSPGRIRPKQPLPEIVRAFKTFSARRINELRMSPGQPVWQRSYYDHVIRDEESLERIRDYIFTNPLRWSMDRENLLQTVAYPFDAWLSGKGQKRVPRMRS